jgi:DNA-binding LacI/PurR family transcriptional regulator
MVRKLPDQIRSGTANQNRITVPTELIIRGSTAPVYQEKEGSEK